MRLAYQLKRAKARTLDELILEMVDLRNSGKPHGIAIWLSIVEAELGTIDRLDGLLRHVRRRFYHPSTRLHQGHREHKLVTPTGRPRGVLPWISGRLSESQACNCQGFRF
jgi:hypothetical protein